MIFVDDLFTMESADPQAFAVGARNGHRWCHCWTDGDVAELDRFAVSIGLRVAWRDGDHYDLTPSRRARALRAGAVRAPEGSPPARAWGARRRGGRKLRCQACGQKVYVLRGEEPPAACPACGRATAPPSPPGTAGTGDAPSAAAVPAARPDAPADGPAEGGGPDASTRPLVF